MLGSHLHGVDADFGVLFLRLQLELNIEQGDFRIVVGLGLHFEPSVAEGLLEGDA